jgi:hypothetical protein
MNITSYLLGKKSGGGSAGGLDWTALGFDKTPSSIKDIYNSAKDIQNSWDSQQTDHNSEFSRSEIVVFPYVDFSNVTNAMSFLSYNQKLENIAQLDTKSLQYCQNMFNSCKKLKNIGVFDFSNVQNAQNIFSYCSSLTNNDLNNILKTFSNTPKYANVSDWKTLKFIGLSQAQAEICTTLSNYQAFINNGWTTGY